MTTRPLVKMLALLMIAAALAGCTGGDDGGGDDAMDGDGTGDGSGGTGGGSGGSGGSGGGTGGSTGGGTTPPPAAPEPQPRWANQTDLQGLVDCTVLGALIGAGAPLEVLSQHAEVEIEEGDWLGDYQIALTADAAGEQGLPSQAGLCVGFSTDGAPLSFSHGTSGEVPDQATTMLIGADFTFQGEVAVLLIPDGYTGPTPQITAA